MFGKSTTYVFDGCDVDKFEGEEIRKSLINDVDWTNYIINYKNVGVIGDNNGIYGGNCH